MYQPRVYRSELNRERFRFLACSHFESDLMIGVPHDRFSEEMEQCALNEMKRIRRLLEACAKVTPAFFTSLEPLPDPSFDFNSGNLSSPQKGLSAGSMDGFPAGSTSVSPAASPEILTMLRCGRATGTGPMSSVAGLFAEQVGRLLASEFGLMEVLVENGGDLFLMNQSPVTAVIHAGGSPISGTMGLVIPPGTWGICTSSGTVGHSFSFGKADAVTVVTEEAPLADAWATALANQVDAPDDIRLVMEKVSHIPEILGCVVILGDRIGIRGRFELKPVS